MATPTIRLTPVEKKIFQLLATGLTVQEICDQEYTSRKTVEFHKANVLKKLEVNTTLKAIIALSREGIIQVDWRQR